MAKSTKKPTTINPAKTGPLSYRQLQMLNASGAGSTWNFNTNYAPAQSFFFDRKKADPIQLATNNEDFLGNSMWDKTDEMSDVDWRETYEDPFRRRAENQPTAMKWANDLFGCQELALSTFLNSTVGLVAGLNTGIYRSLFEGKGWDGFTSGFWDNIVTNALSDLDEWTAEATKNYYTKEEEQRPWYEKLFSEQMWGNGLLRNMGFTIGAIGAAYLTGGLGVGSVLGKGLQILGAGEKAIKIGSGIGNMLVNGLFSAMGEASIEAHQGVHDIRTKIDNDLQSYADKTMAQIDEEYYRDIQNGVDENLADAKRNHKLDELQSNIDKIENNSLKNDLDVGNSIFGSNVALLAITNSLEFPRIMKGGWGTNQLFKKTAFKKGKSEVAREVAGRRIGVTAADDALFGRGLATGESKLVNTAERGTWKDYVKSGIMNTLTEGTEEGSQRLISDSNQMQAYAKMQKTALEKGWIDRALDPTITNDLAKYTKALGHAWQEGFNSVGSAGWEEVFLGAMTGILGVPMIGRKADGKFGLTWQGGFREGYQEKEDHYKRVQQKVDLLNSVLDVEKLKNHARHASAGLSLMQDKRLAFFNDDHVTFKNLQMAQAISDAILLKSQLDSGDAYISFLDELLNQGLSDQFIDEYKAMTALDFGMDLSKTDLDNDISNDELKQRIAHDIENTKNYTQQALNDWDTLKKDKRTDKLSAEAFNELFTSYSLSNNMKQRIAQITEENENLDPNSPIYQQIYKQNEKDIKRLQEDSKVLDDRVAQALDNPEGFNALIDNKLKNAQRRITLKANEESINDLKNANSIQEVASIYYSLGKDVRDTVLQQAYDEGDADIKQRIDAFRNFEGDTDTVFYSIQEALKDHIKNKREHAQRRNDVDRQNYETWRKQRVEDLKVEGNNRLNSLLDSYLKNGDIIDSLRDQQFEDESIQQMYDSILPQLEAIEERRPKSPEEIDDEIKLDSLDAWNSLKNLLGNLYNDMILKDNNGVTGLTVASELKNLLQTLYRDGSLDLETLNILSKALDNLNTLDKIRETKKKIEEAHRAQQENSKDKQDDSKNDNKKDEDKSDNKPIISLNDFADEHNIKIGDRLRNLNLSVYHQANSKEYNDKHFPDKGLQKIAGRILRHLIANPTADQVTQVVTAIKQGYSINTTMLDQLANHLNDYINKLTDEEFKTLFDAVKDVTIQLDNVEDEESELPLDDTNLEEEKKEEILHEEEDISELKGDGEDVDDNYEDSEQRKQKEQEAQDQGFDAYGNQIKEYDYQDGELGVLTKNTNSALVDTMVQTDNVHPQYAIDNLLKLLSKDTPVYHITAGGEIVYLGIKFTPDVESKINKLQKYRFTIVDTNDGKYVITGTLDMNTPGTERYKYFTRVKTRLLEGKKKQTSKFYVDTNFYTKYKYQTGGDIIREVTGDSKNDNLTSVSLADLLDGRESNPTNMTIRDLSFGVIMGNAAVGYTFETLLTKKGKKYLRPKTIDRPGEVYVYIPSAHPNIMVPVKLSSESLDSVSYNGSVADGFKQTSWYKEIERMGRILTDPNNKSDKLKVFFDLTDNYLIFNKTHSGTVYKQEIQFFKKDNKLKYQTKDGKWENIDTFEQFEQILQQFNPRLNIRKKFLKTNLDFLLNSGILRTDVKILGTVGSRTIVYGLDDSFNIIESDIQQEEKQAEQEESEKIEQYVNHNRYQFINNQWYVNGTQIVGLLPEELIDALLIRNGQYKEYNETVRTGSTRKNVKYYILSDNKVYVDEIETNDYRTGYNLLSSSEAIKIVKKYNELQQKEEKKEERKEKEKEKKKEDKKPDSTLSSQEEAKIKEDILSTIKYSYNGDIMEELYNVLYDSPVYTEENGIDMDFVQQAVAEYLLTLNPNLAIGQETYEYPEIGITDIRWVVKESGRVYGSPLDVLVGYYQNKEKFVQLLNNNVIKQDNSKDFSNFAPQIQAAANEVAEQVIGQLEDYLADDNDLSDTDNLSAIPEAVQIAQFISTDLTSLLDMRLDDIASKITAAFEQAYKNNRVDITGLSNATPESLINEINRINNC